MLASACAPKPDAMIAHARERFLSPYVEVETYAGCRCVFGGQASSMLSRESNSG